MKNTTTFWHTYVKTNSFQGINVLIAGLFLKFINTRSASAHNTYGLVALSMKFLPLKSLTFALLSLTLVACYGGANNSEMELQMVDSDNDGYINLYDVDDDGDGLIELMTAAEFNLVRNNLDGTGFSTAIGEKGESYGCGGGTTIDGMPINTCKGYELMNDISLIDYESWQPIGHCSANNECEDAFNAIFNGNGYSISDLSIEIDRLAFGVGLFGAISPDSELHNVHVRNAMVVFEPAGAPYDVGVLVGYGRGAYITDSSVVGADIYTTAFDAGSLIGDGEGATIAYSYADVGMIRGKSEVGGLIGGGSGANILFSCASAIMLDGTEEVGGLLGDGRDATIISSYALADMARGTTSVGTLAGTYEGSNMKDSYAMADTTVSNCMDIRSL